MKRKHGTSQYRLNRAKEHANLFIEYINRIEFMWHLSDEGLISDEVAENFIRRTINEVKINYEEFESYISYRDDMKTYLNDTK